MKKNLTTIVFIVFAQLIFSQNFGFYGKKNLVDLNVSVYTPLIQKWFDDGDNNVHYKSSGGNLVDYKDRIEAAYSLSYLRSLSKKMSFGIEIGFQKLDVSIGEYMGRQVYNSILGYTDYESMTGKLEDFNCSHMFIVPKFEFSKDDGIFGMGIKNQIGFGIGRTTFKEKDYLFDLRYENYASNGYSIALTESQKTAFKSEMYNFEQNKFKNFIIFYALNFRKPLSKNLFLNYGFKYTLNIINRSADVVNENNKYWIKNFEMESLIRQDRLSNVVSFKLGVSYAF